MIPGIAIPYFSSRARDHAQRYFESAGIHAIGREILSRYGETVLSGPFRGLKLPRSSFSEHVSPYLLGVYESELHAIWEALCLGDYRQIIDVGAKFGYYAAGLSMRLADVPVFAFDTDRWARDAIGEIRTINRLEDRIRVLGFCDLNWLRQHLSPGALVVSDCEGYEGTLLDPVQAPALLSASIVVELHEHESPGVAKLLRNRFGKSHRICELMSDEAQRLAPVDLSFLSPQQAAAAMSDLRPKQSWLVMVPKASTNPSVWTSLDKSMPSVGV
jgi:hypothetical protein